MCGHQKKAHRRVSAKVSVAAASLVDASRGAPNIRSAPAIWVVPSRLPCSQVSPRRSGAIGRALYLVVEVLFGDHVVLLEFLDLLW